MKKKSTIVLVILAGLVSVFLFLKSSNNGENQAMEENVAQESENTGTEEAGTDYMANVEEVPANPEATAETNQAVSPETPVQEPASVTTENTTPVAQ